MDNDIVKEHYYGDAVRVIFVVAGLAMIVMFSFFCSLLKIPVILPIIFVLALAIFGGFLNPKQLWIIVVNTIISVLACAIFQYYAVDAYLTLSPTAPLNVWFFWMNQILAVLFFVATYLSVKSWRGKVVVSAEANAPQ